MPRAHTFLLTLALLVSTVLAAPIAAHAQATDPQATDEPSEPETSDAEARRVFDIGASAFDAGRFDEALEHFERAYELSPRPQLLYNLGLSLDRLRRDDEAIARYEEFLSAVPQTPKRAEVEGRLRALRAAVLRQQEERDRLAREGRGQSDRDESGGILASPWFWVVAGVLVVGGAVLTIALLSTGDQDTQPPIPGTNGGVITALSW